MKHHGSSSRPRTKQNKPGHIDWKGTLQSLLDRHNVLHAHRGKTVSHRTRDQRANSLFRIFGLLRSLGCKVNPVNLGDRHVRLLVRYWTASAGLPDELRREGIQLRNLTFPAQPLSAAYIQQQLSFLRVFSTWIGKPGLVLTPTAYVENPSLVTRRTVAVRDLSWAAADLDIKDVIDAVTRIDPFVGLQLEVMLAFGLRRKEAVMFAPGLAEVPAHALPPGAGDGQRYLAFLRIKRGTKGGRLRFTAIRNEHQRAALERARASASSITGHIGIPGRTLKQALDRFSNVLRSAGLSRKTLGVTAHGLRHQFASDLYIELTEVRPPVSGVRPTDADLMNAAYLEVARQLGHGRPQIAGAYLGKRSAPRSTPAVLPSNARPGLSPDLDAPDTWLSS